MDEKYPWNGWCQPSRHYWPRGLLIDWPNEKWPHGFQIVMEVSSLVTLSNGKETIFFGIFPIFQFSLALGQNVVSQFQFLFSWVFSFVLDNAMVTALEINHLPVANMSISRSVSRSVSRSISRSVSSSVSRSLCWSVSWSVSRFHSRPVSRSASQSASRSASRSVCRSVSRFLSRSVSRSAIRSVSRPKWNELKWNLMKSNEIDCIFPWA